MGLQDKCGREAAEHRRSRGRASKVVRLPFAGAASGTGIRDRDAIYTGLAVARTTILRGWSQVGRPLRPPRRDAAEGAVLLDKRPPATGVFVLK